jgi:hypothetical protein
MLRTVVVRNPPAPQYRYRAFCRGWHFIPNKILTGKGSLKGGPF